MPDSSSTSSDRRTLEALERVLAETYRADAVPGDDGEQFPIYPTATDAAQGKAIRSLIVEERAAKTFEVGFALGLSTLNIAAGLLEVGQPDATHAAIDPTESWLWKNAGRRLVESAGLQGLVEMIEESSHTLLPRWLAEERHGFDVAFIDGDHRFDPCFLDIYYALRLVKPAGLVVVDDMWMPSVRTAVAFFESNIDLDLLTDAIPGAFRWSKRVPWRKVRAGSGNTAVLRKPATHVERPGEHFVPFW
jgi:predicted O-methyltransferase YrrM